MVWAVRRHPSGPGTAGTSANTSTTLQDMASRVRERGVALGTVILLHAALIAMLAPSLRPHFTAVVPTRIEARLIERAAAPHDPPPWPPVTIASLPLEAIPLPEAKFDIPPTSTAIIVPTQVPNSPRDSAPGPASTRPDFSAAYLSNPAPVYPAMSRRLREAGVVLLRVRVTTQGRPAEVLLEHTSGFVRLDEAAIATVKHWRFVPARRGSNLAEAWVLVPVEFVLNVRR